MFLHRDTILVIACIAASLKCDLVRTDFLLKYPYQSVVRLQPVIDNMTLFTEPLCTGTIVNSVYILTYARCSEYAYYKGPMNVVFVTSNIYGADNSTEQIGRWIRHEFYRNLPDTYDLALVELQHVISFNHFVHPAVMYYGDVHLIETHLSCAIIGWDDALINEHTSIYFSLLSIIDVQILLKEQCQKVFPDFDNVTCAVPLGTHKMCQLDWGTPLACGVNNIWVFFGIYIGVNTCASGGPPVTLFRKIDGMHEWLKTLANGAYVVDGNSVNKTNNSTATSFHDTRIFNFSFINVVILIVYLLCLHIRTR